MQSEEDNYKIKNNKSTSTDEALDNKKLLETIRNMITKESDTDKTFYTGLWRFFELFILISCCESFHKMVITLIGVYLIMKMSKSVKKTFTQSNDCMCVTISTKETQKRGKR